MMYTFLSVVVVTLATPPENPVRLTADPADPKRSVFEVIALDRDALATWKPDADRPALVVSLAEAPDAPPLRGAVAAEGGRLIFRPHYPLLPGVRYRVAYHPDRVISGGPTSPITVELSLPSAGSGEPAALRQVFPSGSELPENLLRFYLHFSAPMRQSEAFDHIRLLDAAGKTVERAFLGQELWDHTGTRLTVLLDPGRIKRGLVPHEEQGPPLTAGRSYTLVVDAAWRDAAGRPLAAPLRQPFRTTAAERTPIDPATWRLLPAAAGSRDPLEVRFPRPLDHALLQRTLTVIDAVGRPVAGTIAVDEAETRWRFTPATAWAAGAYRLVIDPVLEDQAGNRIGRPFDAETPAEVPTAVSRPFTVAGK